MRTAKGLTAGCAAVVAMVLALSTGAVRAEVSTERPGSILIFPKVVNSQADARTTVIQVTNTSNLTRYARCFYLNGAPENPNLDPNPVTNPPLCSVTDFELTLTRQQPTHWLVKTGRRVDPTDGVAGIDPGSIPPVPEGFQGELICVEVDESGAPVAANSLKGEAMIGSITGADVSRYNAVAVRAVNPNGDLDLEMNDGEYNGCPGNLVVNSGLLI